MRMAREAFEGAEEERELALECLRYYHGDQINQEVRAALRLRGQPITYWNKIRSALDGTLGLLDSSQTDPEAIGRNDDDEDAALLVTEILRYLVDRNDFDEVKREVVFNGFTQGIGASISEVDSRTGDARTSPIPYNEFFYDPASIAPDFRDAQYMGRARWVYASVARRSYPDRADILRNPFAGCFTGAGGPEDRPEYKGLWVKPNDRRVLLVELYYIDEDTGRWMRAHFCHAGVLDWGESAYQDDLGELCCPITAFSFQVDHDGRRYGMIKDMLRLQDNINNRLSKMLHITNSARIRVTEQAGAAKANEAQLEASKPNGIIPFGIEPVNQTADFEGNLKLLENDVQAIERMAPSPALLGRASGANESGRARQILQQAGLTELASGFARYEGWELRTYRQMWFRAQQYMTDTRMIRVTNQAGVRQSLQINVPVMGTVVAPVVDPSTGQPVLDPQTGHPRMMPQAQQVGTRNELAAMDMDISLKTVRQSDTLRQEAINGFLEFCAKAGVSPLSPQAELVIEMSDIEDKQYLLTKMRELQQKEAQQNAGQQAQQQQAAQHARMLAEAGTESKIQRDQAQASRDNAMAEKHAVDAHEAAFDLAIKQRAFGQALDNGVPPLALLNGTNGHLPSL
jgi:hypothetical protein